MNRVHSSAFFERTPPKEVPQSFFVCRGVKFERREPFKKYFAYIEKAHKQFENEFAGESRLKTNSLASSYEDLLDESFISHTAKNHVEDGRSLDGAKFVTEVHISCKTPRLLTSQKPKLDNNRNYLSSGSKRAVSSDLLQKRRHQVSIETLGRKSGKSGFTRRERELICLSCKANKRRKALSQTSQVGLENGKSGTNSSNGIMITALSNAKDQIMIGKLEFPGKKFRDNNAIQTSLNQLQKLQRSTFPIGKTGLNSECEGSKEAVLKCKTHSRWGRTGNPIIIEPYEVKSLNSLINSLSHQLKENHSIRCKPKLYQPAFSLPFPTIGEISLLEKRFVSSQICS